MSRQKYPSDLSREQFQQILPLLESVRKRTKPRTVDLYEVFCAVLYLLKSGCQWRMLPRDFPKWRTVHSYFAKWSEPDQHGVSVLERALKKSGWRGLHQAGTQLHDQLNCTRLSSCPSDGSWKDLSGGWRNGGGCGRTARENSIQAYSSSTTAFLALLLRRS